MSEPVIAVTHPGKIGDALSAMPAARGLAERHGCQVDFWTSKVVEPARDLIEAQRFVRRVVINTDYRMEHASCGVQPWFMSNAEDPRHGYKAVYQLGFRETPAVPLVEYCCTLVGLPQMETKWNLPIQVFWGLPQPPFVVLAASGQTSFRETFLEFVRKCPLSVVEVGIPEAAIINDMASFNRTDRGFLSMAGVISRCAAFVGLMSAPLVVANGFPCRRIGLHDGHNDMRHVIRTPLNHYPEGHDPELLLQHVRDLV